MGPGVGPGVGDGDGAIEREKKVRREGGKEGRREIERGGGAFSEAHSEYFNAVLCGVYLMLTAVTDDGEIDPPPHRHHVHVGRKQLHLQPPRWLHSLVTRERGRQAPHVSSPGTNVEVANQRHKKTSGEIFASCNRTYVNSLRLQLGEPTYLNK